MLLLCDRCGFEIEKSTSFHSRHTGTYYCLSFEDCERRVTGNYTLTEVSEGARRATARLDAYRNALLRGES